ncbi:putative sphingomyelinase [Cavenderia fasciculata]|uniref:Sphingomyelinase n=1 Tax=Cavenderia fasciculata TaxID=261658 RepID=F4QCG6_CACFS|nr:putative sphingomyelinase [Cavenderia fasciculata]EGG13601.1 putative sphingomyelinase [Cavenderia fasciculata]|eukprot:XP_004350305.1 putative sphingomyelinase [Cavenderia fasciculata]
MTRLNSSLWCVVTVIVALMVHNASSYTFMHLSDVHYSSMVNTVLYNDSTLCLASSLFKSQYIQDLEIPIFNDPLTHSGLYGRYGCDTNLELFNSTLVDMFNNYDLGETGFIVFTGDSAGHALPYDDWSNSVITFSKVISETYSGTNTTFIPSIGNNDVFPDYNSSCSDGNLEFLASVWDEWIPESQKANFLKMGSYAVSPAPGLTVLAVNTVLYSVKQKNIFSGDPCGQFAWLTNELEIAAANNNTVYIIGHIFPGLDPFFQIETWKEDYIFQFMDVVKNYTDIVKGGFFGHIHRDEYRSYDLSIPPTPDTQHSAAGHKEEDVFSNSDMFFPLFIGSAISPLYQNNPSYKVYQATPTFSIYNITTYYSDLYVSNFNGYINWTVEYNFAEEYKIQSEFIDGAALADLTTRFFMDPVMYARYDDHRAANFLPDIVDTLCLNSQYSDKAWSNCVQGLSLASAKKMAEELYQHYPFQSTIHNMFFAKFAILIISALFAFSGVNAKDCSKSNGYTTGYTLSSFNAVPLSGGQSESFFEVGDTSVDFHGQRIRVDYEIFSQGNPIINGSFWGFGGNINKAYFLNQGVCTVSPLVTPIPSSIINGTVVDKTKLGSFDVDVIKVEPTPSSGQTLFADPKKCAAVAATIFNVDFTNPGFANMLFFDFVDQYTESFFVLPSQCSQANAQLASFAAPHTPHFSRYLH